MVRPNRGFTLLEMAITLLIIALVLGMAVPMTMGWANSAHVRKAETSLTQGFRHAKALAIRNPNGLTSGAAAGIKLSSGVLLVCAGDPTASSCNASNAVWQATLPNSASVSLAGTASTWTLGISNTGTPNATSTYAITEGSENATGTLL